MRTFVLAIMLWVVLGSCAGILGIPPDVNVEYHIGGQIHGLWDRADGVFLKIKTDFEASLSVSEDGDFLFPELYPSDTSYTTTIDVDPLQHTCVIEAGRTGKVMDTDIKNMSIGCKGPGTVTIAGLPGWVFDPTRKVQTFEGSTSAPDVVLTITLTVTGSTLNRAVINDKVAGIGQDFPVQLRAGSTTVDVRLSANGGLSKSYQLIFVIDTQRTDDCNYSRKPCIPK